MSASAVSKVSAAGIRPTSPRNGISRAYWCGRSWGESEGESEGFDGLLAFLPRLLPDIDRWPGALPQRLLDGTGIQ